MAFPAAEESMANGTGGAGREQEDAAAEAAEGEEEWSVPVPAYLDRYRNQYTLHRKPTTPKSISVVGPERRVTIPERL
jgi:hypothetical protein